MQELDHTPRSMRKISDSEGGMGGHKGYEGRPDAHRKCQRPHPLKSNTVSVKHRRDTRVDCLSRAARPLFCDALAFRVHRQRFSSPSAVMLCDCRRYRSPLSSNGEARDIVLFRGDTGSPTFARSHSSDTSIIMSTPLSLLLLLRAGRIVEEASREGASRNIDCWGGGTPSSTCSVQVRNSLNPLLLLSQVALSCQT